MIGVVGERGPGLGKATGVTAIVKRRARDGLVAVLLEALYASFWASLRASFRARVWESKRLFMLAIALAIGMTGYSMDGEDDEVLKKAQSKTKSKKGNFNREGGGPVGWKWKG